MKKHFLILPLVLLACACEEQPFGSEALPPLVWGTDSLCIENPIAPGESSCYQIQLKLDTLPDSLALAGQLTTVLCDSVLYTPGCATIGEAMTAFADSVEAEWKAELAERYEPESEYKDMFQYHYFITGNPVDNALDSIMSYQVLTSCYLGGAHGSHVVQYFNFERKSGKLLTIQDIVPPAKETLMLKAMQDRLCKDYEVKDIAELQEQTGITMLGDLYLTNNFLLQGDSILFLFNQYDIAPYAAGLISVTLPRP